MSLTSSASFDVADQAAESDPDLVALATIQPPVGVSTGRGRLVHPDLGALDYTNTPDETVDIDGGPIYRPIWVHSMTAASGADALWQGNIRDSRVIERWIQGDVGMPIAFLRVLQQYFANAPDPSGTPVIWAPNYTTTRTFHVALIGLRSGGEAYTLKTRLRNMGYAPQPVELEMRVIDEI